MESSIESTIEKIKLQEHAIEAKLKEKRTRKFLYIDSKRMGLSRYKRMLRTKELAFHSNALSFYR